MKQLKIYKHSDEFVLERVNEFNHVTKRFFISENGLLEALEDYPDLSQYDVQVAPDIRFIYLNLS